MSNVFTKRYRNGALLPLRWKDNWGVMHSAEGAEVHQGITLVWTRCRCLDVPADASWAGSDEITCDGCRYREKTA